MEGITAYKRYFGHFDFRMSGMQLFETDIFESSFLDPSMKRVCNKIDFKTSELCFLKKDDTP